MYKKGKRYSCVNKRTIKFINGDTFKLLYKSLVRPILELTGSVWNPYKLKHIRSLESVQRRATKLVRAIKDLPYEDRLRTLDLPTLTYRRSRGDMISTFKIFKGYIEHIFQAERQCNKRT